MVKIDAYMIENVLKPSNLKEILSDYSYYLTEAQLRKIPPELLREYKGHGHFTPEFIDQHADDLNWKNSSVYDYITSDLIRKYNKKVDWDYLSASVRLAEEIMIEYQDRLSWRNVCKKQLLTPRIYIEASENIDWYYACEFQPLTEEIIEQNFKSIEWQRLSDNKYLTINMILKYWGKFNQFTLFERFSIEQNFRLMDEKPISNVFPPVINIDYDELIDELVKKGIFPEAEYKENFTISPKTPINDTTAAKLLGRINFDELLENALLSEKFLTSLVPKLKKGHWKIISEHQQLTESFILEHASSLDWDRVITYQKISPTLGESIIIYLKSSKLLKQYITRHRVSYDISNDLVGNVDWLTISKYGNLSEEFIDKFHNELDWRFLIRYQTITEPLINKYSEKIRWNLACRHQLLTETILRKYSDNLNWRRVSQFQELSEQFIRDFTKQLNWDLMSKWQNLSERLILAHEKEVNWNLIARHQKLSNSFIDQYLNQLSLLHLSRNPNVDAFHINRIREKNSLLLKENYDNIVLFSALQNIVVNEDFLEEHWNDISGFIFHVSRYQPLSEKFLLRHSEHFSNLNEGGILQNNLSDELLISYLDSGNSISFWTQGISISLNIYEDFNLSEVVLNHLLSLNNNTYMDRGLYAVLEHIKFSWRELRYYEDHYNNYEKYYNHEAEFIEDIIEYYNWNSSFKINDILHLIEDYPEFIRWDVISGNEGLPIEFIRKYKDYLFWDLVSSNTKLPMDLILELINFLQPSKLEDSGFYTEKEIKDIKTAKNEHNSTIRIPRTVDDFKDLFRRASIRPSDDSQSSDTFFEEFDDEDYDYEDEDDDDYNEYDEDFLLEDHEYSYSLRLMFLEKEMLNQTDISKLIELNGEAGYYNKKAFYNLTNEGDASSIKYFFNKDIQAIQSHEVVDFDWNNVADITQTRVQYVYWSTGQPLEGSKIYNGKYEVMIIPEHLPLDYRLIVGGNRINVKQVESNQINKDVLSKSINELAISPKLITELVEFTGLRTIGELLFASEEKIASVKGLSSKSTKTYQELETAMIDLGLGLRKPVAYVKPSIVLTMEMNQVINESNGVLANEIDWPVFLEFHNADSISIVMFNSEELKKHKVYDLDSLDNIADVSRFHNSEQDKILSLLEKYKELELIFVPIYMAEG